MPRIKPREVDGLWEADATPPSSFHRTAATPGYRCALRRGRGWYMPRSHGITRKRLPTAAERLASTGWCRHRRTPIVKKIELSRSACGQEFRGIGGQFLSCQSVAAHPQSQLVPMTPALKLVEDAVLDCQFETMRALPR
jgi:hypothetical protein